MQICIREQQLLHRDLNTHKISSSTNAPHLTRLTYNFQLFFFSPEIIIVFDTAQGTFLKTLVS